MKIIRICFCVAVAIVVIMVVVFAVRNDRSYGEMHNGIKTRIESFFDSLPFDSFFKESFHNYLRATSRAHFNEVTFLTDGRLMSDTQKKRVFFYERADEILNMYEYLQETGTPFLYVRIPNKLQDNSVLPIAFSNNTFIESADYLVSILEDNGVDVLDLYVEMHRDGVDFYSAYFNGDHHWTAETSLWAFGKIGEFVNREYGYNLSEKTWDPQQHDFITFEQAFLGEESESVYALNNYENITFVVPKFTTAHDVFELTEENYMGHLVSGSFTDVFTPMVKNEYAERILYHEFNVMQWYRSFNRYINPEASEKKKILFIADSMGWPLGPQFAVGFETVDNFYLVPRANYRVWSAIDKYDYDLVVFALSDGVLAYEDSDLFVEDRVFLGRPWD